MLKKFRRVVSIISAAVMAAVTLAVSAPASASAAESEDYSELVKEISVLVNEAREEAGLEPLYISPYICEIAEKRASECVSVLNHIRPNGAKFSTIVDFDILPYRKISENIAAGFSSASDTFEQWKNSPEHWAAIMNPSYTHLGIGVVYEPESFFHWYWTQLFVRTDIELEGQALFTREDLSSVSKNSASEETAQTAIGDVNGDGHINSFDCISLYNYIIGKNQLSAVQRVSADVTQDGEISIADVVTLRKYILGAYTSLPTAS